jgi:hypothetical protein
VTTRLFAFGGTRYEVRTRLGEWPETFADTTEFESLAGLPVGENRLAFGVGLRPTPTLILRQRQSEQDRGGYAYTVLLDPGRELWTRCGWNAARLLLAMRRDAELWRGLLLEPERLVTSFLQARLAALSFEAQPEARVSDPLALFADAVVSSSVDGEDVALSVRPDADSASPNAVASLLDSLPIAFRCGRGWMIGGSTGGRALGTAVIVAWNDAAPMASPSATPSLDGLRAVLDHSGSGRLAALLELPVHEWPGNVQRVMSHAALLAALARTHRLDDAVADVRPDDELAADVRRQVLAFAATGDAGRFSEAVSTWLLAAHHGLADVPPDLARRLHVDVLAAALRGSGRTPADPVVTRLGWVDSDVVALWEAHLRNAPPDRVVDVFADAAQQLRLADPAAGAELAGRLFAAAMRRPDGNQPRARAWLALRGKPTLWPHVAPRLAEYVRERDLKDDEDRVDYLTGGDDLGATWLAATRGPDAVTAVARLALARLTDRALAHDARAWLEALAHSPARLDLPLALKLQVATCLDGGWRSLEILLRLLSGESTLTPYQARGAESVALTRELVDAVKDVVEEDGPVASAPAHLDRIAALIGAAIPEPVLASITDALRLTDASVQWLRDRGHADLARVALRHDWRHLPAACATASAEDVAVLLSDLHLHSVSRADVQALLSVINPDVVEAAIDPAPDLAAWLATRLLAPGVSIASLATRLPAAVWMRLFETLERHDRRRLVDAIGALEHDPAGPTVGALLLAHIAARPGIREYVAVTIEGSTWDAVEPLLRERFGLPRRSTTDDLGERGNAKPPGGRTMR